MRTVLSVDPVGVIDPATGSEMMVLKALKSPFHVAEAGKAKPFSLCATEMAAWGEPNSVRLRGQLIRERLGTHAGIKALLQHLETTPLNQINPLYVVLSEGDAELISWETLCNGNDEFVALDKRWPIGRISEPMSVENRPAAALRLPVKVMAVISAFGIPGQAKEWELFRDAILETRAAGFDVRLKLLVGDSQMRDAIDHAIAAGLTGVEVSHIDKTGSRVIQEIISWAPNILHFFCHGIADAGEQSLELATASDYANGAGGTVKIRTKQLADMSFALSNPWLLTLNCCASGQAAKDLQSMAHQVVSAGFPAAVAMLEPVDAMDAHEFTRAFYTTVFSALAEIKAKLAGQQQVAFEWLYAMHAARTAICDLHGAPENTREWALPVLYVRGVEPFHFVPASAAPEAAARDFKLEARLVAEWLRVVREDIDAAKRLAIMEKALAGVPKEFWPTVDGTFVNG